VTLIGILLMAILTFAPSAPLSGFESYLMQRGMEATCAPQNTLALEQLAQRLHPGVWAEAGDSVRFSAFLASGSAVIDYGGQWQNEKGIYSRYNHTINISSGSSPVRATRAASAGWYRDAVASLQTAGITGQTLYITQELGRQNAGAFAPFAMLAQGWLTSTAPVSSGGPPLPDGGGSGAGGSGCCIGTLVEDFFNPNTENPQIHVGPVGGASRLVYLSYNYTTSAIAGNRRQYLALGKAIELAAEIFVLVDQPASTTYGYVFIAGGQSQDDVANNQYIRPLPENLFIDGSYYLTVQASNSKAGDAWSSAVPTYEEIQ